MKKGLSLFLSLIMVMSVFLSVPVTVNAASIDDLTFELNEEGTMYQVVDCDYKASGEIVIPEIYNGLPVTKIGSSAFESCYELTSVEIPDSVTNIGGSAFYHCESLTSITIPDSVTSIGDHAFGFCESLTSITIPDSVTSIGGYAFRYCESLTSIKLSKSLKEIEWYTFIGCESLTSISIPDGVEDIRSYAFYDCKSLTTVTIPNSVTSIRGSAFYGCSSLKSITIPDSVTLVGSSAFCGCSLTSITIPDSVWLIGDNAFGYKYNSWEEKIEKVEGFTIYGVKGSEAEVYAKENAFAFVNICEHKTTEWITEKKATVNSAGKKVKKCTKCGEVFETAEIPQLKCSKPKLSKIENTADGVKITWGKVTGADKYDVYRKTGSSGKYSKIGTTSKTYYTDKKASSGKKYYYYLKAVNEAGASSASSSKSILYLADTTLSTPKSTKSGIALKWKKITGADGYQVYRKTGSGSYSKIATVKGNSKVTYTDKSAKKGKTYTYKIKAYKSKTYSAYSNTKKIKDKY